MRFKHRTLILGLIVLMFVADAANTILVYKNLPFFRISIVVRLVAQLYFMLLLLRKPNGRMMLLVTLALYAIFIIGTIGSLRLFKDYNIVENFVIVNKILFFLICWQVLAQYFTGVEARIRLFTVFEWIILIQISTVIVGFVFHLDVFSSYSSVDNIRFGYKGLIPAQNETTGFFIIAFFYALWKVNYWGKGIPLLLGVSAANLLTGTKASLILGLMLIAYVIYQLIYQILIGRLKKYYVLIILSFVFVCIVAIVNFEYFLFRIEPSINYFRYKIEVEQLDLVSIISSGRNWRVESVMSEFIPKWTILNYLFGGNDLSKADFFTETDLIDIFTRLGLVGGTLFYFVYLGIFLHAIRKAWFISILFSLIWISVAATAGHLVYSAINAVYLAILLLALSSTQMLKQLKDDPMMNYQVNKPWSLSFALQNVLQRI